MNEELAPGQVVVWKQPALGGTPASYTVEVVRADGLRRLVVNAVPEAIAWAVRDRVAAALAECEGWAVDLVDVSAGQLRG